MLRSLLVAFVLGTTLVLALPYIPRERVIREYADIDPYTSLPLTERERYLDTRYDSRYGYEPMFVRTVYPLEDEEEFGVQGVEQYSLGGLGAFGAGGFGAGGGKKLQYAQPIVTYAQPVVQPVNLQQPVLQAHTKQASPIIQPTYQVAPLMRTQAISATAPTMNKKAGGSMAGTLMSAAALRNF